MHWLFEQSCVGLHGLPQSRMLPHPSDAGPHTRPICTHVFGTHDDAPQTFGAPPPPHSCPSTQSPQWIAPPQPSGKSPQFAPIGHVFFVHAGAPHWPGTPPPPHV
jgi:hypothetical protein